MSAWLQGKSDRRGASVLAAEQVGVVRISHMVDVYQIDSRLSQAVVDRMVGQLPGGERDGALGVLLVCEAFLLGGGDDRSITDQAGGRIMIDCVDPQRVHCESS